ncbi:MAG: hypothetical protein QOF71_950 [Candidatus Eremiobacteraeota bacterium]|nr:hypothetical protein [Candidatus Eremiobacteraeota bacterium]
MSAFRNQVMVAATAIALALAVPSLASAEPQRLVAGTVVDFHGKYGLVVRDAQGALASVTLHQGTVIKPEGLRLERGMKVIITGLPAAQTFAAAQILAPLEQWPTARAIANSRPRASDKPDALTSSRDPNNTRWSSVPDQYSLPYSKEPPR